MNEIWLYFMTSTVICPCLHFRLFISVQSLRNFYQIIISIFASDFVIDKHENSLNKTFVEYIDGARQYLESESDKDLPVLQDIRLHFSRFIRQLISNTPSKLFQYWVLLSTVKVLLFFVHFMGKINSEIWFLTKIIIFCKLYNSIIQTMISRIHKLILFPITTKIDTHKYNMGINTFKILIYLQEDIQCFFMSMMSYEAISVTH